MESSSTRIKSPRTERIKAAKALRKVPMALLLKKKAECDAKALKIVEQMMEPQVDIDWLKNILPRINKSHMEDVVEERSIVKLCGYVLCDKPLTKVVKKQYQISTSRNKVYDVAKVKNYCSFGCYRAAEFLMEQIQTSPLWARDDEDVPDFKFMEKPVFGGRSSPPGVEINLTGIEIPQDSDEPEEESSETKKEATETEELEKLLEDFEMTDNSKLTRKGEKEEIPETKSDLEMCLKVEKSNPEELNSKVVEKSKTQQPESSSKNPEQDSATESPKSNESESLPSQKLPKSPRASLDSSSKTRVRKSIERGRKSSQTRTKVIYESLASRVEKSFREWITEKTVCLLHGEVEEKHKILEDVKREEKYEILCKKLNRLRIEEEREAKENVGDFKPAPNFLALQEEARGLELKVRAFWQGKTVIDRESTKMDTKPEDTETEVSPVLPMIDLHAPNALRRRIFLDKLNKVIPDLLRTLIGQSSDSQFLYDAERCALVKTLVSTFALDSTNIIFKTAEWTLVALLIIKLLGQMDQRTKFLLSKKQTTMYISMILMSYKLESNYLDNLIESLTSPKATREPEESVNFNM